MSSLPETVQRVFRDALAQVPQKVLWKYEGDMKDIPKNVIIRKWFPQRDILCTHYYIELMIYSFKLDYNIETFYDQTSLICSAS
jgi:glucuronosyltransferase